MKSLDTTPNSGAREHSLVHLLDEYEPAPPTQASPKPGTIDIDAKPEELGAGFLGRVDDDKPK